MTSERNGTIRASTEPAEGRDGELPPKATGKYPSAAQAAPAPDDLIGGRPPSERLADETPPKPSGKYQSGNQATTQPANQVDALENDWDDVPTAKPPEVAPISAEVDRKEPPVSAEVDRKEPLAPPTEPRIVDAELAELKDVFDGTPTNPMAIEVDVDMDADAAAESEAEPPAHADTGVPPPSISSRDYIGTTIDGRYRVEALIGEGGMGFVYRCRHKVIDKLVAIKILRQDMARAPDVVERFVVEAKAASAIGNAHITDVLDFGTLPDGSTYLVMEHLDGKSLTELLEAHTRVPIERAVAIARQLAEGLGAAHAAQIVHRDLKPDNVFVVLRNGEDFVKILDFGIAKVGTFQNKITRAGEIFGTPHYMSPEQAKGVSVDQRADIYSLGVMAFEMLTGSVPFDAENPFGILTQHISSEPPSLVERNPEVPATLEAIVHKCLAKSPQDRYRSMAELEADLEKFEEGLAPVAALDLVAKAAQQAAISEQRPPAERQRNRLPMLVLVGVLAVGGVAALGYTLYHPKVGILPDVVSVVRARDMIAQQTAAMGQHETHTGHDVAILLSPLDSHVFDHGKDLGGMPVTVTVPEGRVLELEGRRQYFFPRRFKLDGKKSRVIVRLTPMPGTPPVPVPEAPAGAAEGAEPAAPAKPGAAAAEAAKPSEATAESKPSGPQPGAPALGPPSSAGKKPAPESEKHLDKAPAPASS